MSLVEAEEDDIMQLDELVKEYDEVKQRALKSYSLAMHKAEKNLISSSPVRLSVALNFAVFQYEFMDDANESIRFTRKAVDVAMKKIDQQMDPDDHAEALQIIELLKENIATWEEEEAQR